MAIVPPLNSTTELPISYAYNLIVDDNYDDMILVSELLHALTPKERNMVVLSYITELSLAEIGNIYGVSGARIHQYLRRALRKMRRVGGAIRK